MLDVVTPLLGQWRDLRQVAKEVESPNEEDDLLVKAAIVGFSLFRPTEEWQKHHWQFIEDYRDGDLPDNDSSIKEGEESPYRIFACLALGAILGAFQDGKLSEEEIYTTMSYLPEFLTTHAREISKDNNGT